MSDEKKSITILMADDDPDDRMLFEDAWREGRLANNLRFVEDGEELMDYLLHGGKYAPPVEAPLPGLILLDLNMPKKDGREALQEIRAHPDLRRIPVVILTTSRAEEDLIRSYDLGASGFITKPITFDGLVEAVTALSRYWLEIVELPCSENG